MSGPIDKRQPGNLLSISAMCQSHLVPSLPIKAPSPAAAARIASRVNLVWAQAWADELLSVPPAVESTDGERA